MAKDKPYYPYAPIASIDTLAKTLGVHPKLLRDISKDTSKSYTRFLITTKKGKERDVYEPKYELKKLQKRINSRILEKIEYPFYLQGGIKDPNKPRDYVENARIHAGSKILISLDIKDFYHSIREGSVLPIFKQLLRFPDDVSETLTRLVMLSGKVPQGACTSSYIANLIFHNFEYHLVSKLRSKGLKYTRLLDDITISSSEPIESEKATEIIKDVASMIRRHALRLNPKKTKIEISSNLNTQYEVTGVWVGHGIPKLRKDDRRYVRQLVYICEKEYEKDRFCSEYHDLWNRTSGHVAKLRRLNHPQAKKLRNRLSLILPEYDDNTATKILSEADKILRKPKSTHSRVGVVKKYRKIIHALGILSRTRKAVSKQYRKKLNSHFKDIPTNASLWE